MPIRVAAGDNGGVRLAAGDNAVVVYKPTESGLLLSCSMVLGIRTFPGV